MKTNPEGNTMPVSIEMPRAQDAERAVLGALLIESGAIGQVVDILVPEMFYDSRNETIYRAVLALYDRNVKTDIIALNRQLEASGKLGEAGGYDHILEISGFVFSASNIEEHALYIRQKYIQRKLVEAGYTIMNMAMDDTQDVADVMEYSAGKIDSVVTEAIGGGDMSRISQAAQTAYEKYLERNTAFMDGEKRGVTTGFLRLDKYTGGLAPGDLAVLAARPAMGKTAVALHMARSAAEQGKHAVLFSLEMTSENLAARLLLSYSEVSPARFKEGCLTKEEAHHLYTAKEHLSQLPLSINDTSAVTVRKIKSIASRLVRKGKCDILYIDYLQLVDMRTGNRQYNREQEVAQVSRQCKIMAKELQIPVVLLSQLNRECERRADRMPQLSDLRESGAVEQDADIILFVHRPEYYDNPGKVVGGEEVEEGKGTLIMAKNRNGETGRIDFYYNRSLTKMYSDKPRYSFY